MTRGARQEHVGRVRTHELAAGAELGDDCAHPLPRGGMPHEQHLAIVPGNAVATVGDRAHLDVDDVAGFEARRPFGHWPIRIDPTTDGASRNSSWPSEERNCHGTEATITPVMKCNLARKRKALWLWRSCSYQRPTTYSGM